MEFKYCSPVYLFCTVFLLAICSKVLCSEVPTVLWNIKGNSLHLKPVPAFGDSGQLFDESLKDILRKDSTILVFAVNTLSMEDFSANEKPNIRNNTLQSLETFLDSHPFMLVPDVKDPLNRVHKAHCGVEEIIVDQNVDDNVLRSVSQAISRSCAVILHVPDAGVMTKKDDIKKVFLPLFEKTNKNVVGMFTAMKSSWEVPSETHMFRNLLSFADEDPYFHNISGCMLLYIENATLNLGEKGNDTVTLPLPPDLTGSNCSGNSSFLVMTFKPSGDVSQVVLTFQFEESGGSWITPESTLEVTGSKAPSGKVFLAGNMPGAALGFSYSCGDMNLRTKNLTPSMTLLLNGFQVQPYEVSGAFSDSFDCVPWFTIPIWMGIFVGILFIIIMNTGIYALFSVNTMDRFDDPKGKTITVTATD